MFKFFAKFVLYLAMPQRFVQIQIVTAIFAITLNITVGGGQLTWFMEAFLRWAFKEL